MIHIRNKIKTYGRDFISSSNERNDKATLMYHFSSTKFSKMGKKP